MGHEVTIGGERLGSGGKMKTYLKHYERSTHDQSYIWKSTMASGTLVPFWVELALPGDTFDLNLDCDVLTHPTIGPLFGSYKIQLDVFQIPMRLYNAKLHMNMLGIGLDMKNIFLPQLNITSKNPYNQQPIDNQQINPSCIFSYLNIRGLGYANNANPNREFCAVPFLGYWDIYKNYYANKQEEIGAVIHTPLNNLDVTLTSVYIQTLFGGFTIPFDDSSTEICPVDANSQCVLSFSNSVNMLPQWVFVNQYDDANNFVKIPITDLFQNWVRDDVANAWIGTNPNLSYAYEGQQGIFALNTASLEVTLTDTSKEPQITLFDLKNIDDMRINLLQWFSNSSYIINSLREAPYGLPFTKHNSEQIWSQEFSQEGLALKTYQSDLFNNWISTEWIDGEDGISAITAIDTSGGSFTLDEFNLSKKVYDMLNRIAISGGTYDDWLDAVYTHERQKTVENPIYLGGLIKNLVFQEVVSNAATDNQPLGSLAGRGRIGQKHKGGKVIAKIDEPSFLMGIVSITPIVDYSQGNKWDTNLKTLDDLHKPALDEIGFQDLITDQMAWFDTELDPNTTPHTPIFKSAGKQPAWINYMTNVNIVRGNFADESQQMYMTLNRRYDNNTASNGASSIRDLTTYIDPTKFNHIFADTRRDAQNFWTQIALNITSRRKMSAKVIPNL